MKSFRRSVSLIYNHYAAGDFMSRSFYGTITVAFLLGVFFFAFIPGFEPNLGPFILFKSSVSLAILYSEAQVYDVSVVCYFMASVLEAHQP